MPGRGPASCALATPSHTLPGDREGRRSGSAGLSRHSRANSKMNYRPIKHRAEQRASRCSPGCPQRTSRVLAGHRCHCLLSSWGSPVILFPLILMYFFHPQGCGVRRYESALPSPSLPLHPSQHPLRTRKAVNLTGGQEAFANAPFNAHFFLRAMEELRGKSKNCRNCSFHFLWFHNFVAYQF